MRETDLLFRWGGEEFLLLLPHTRSEEVGAVAERIRKAIADEPLEVVPGEAPIVVTASLGAASEARLPCDYEELVERADSACYRAKELGRNRAVKAEAD